MVGETLLLNVFQLEFKEGAVLAYALCACYNLQYLIDARL